MATQVKGPFGQHVAPRWASERPAPRISVRHQDMSDFSPDEWRVLGLVLAEPWQAKAPHGTGRLAAHCRQMLAEGGAEGDGQ